MDHQQENQLFEALGSIKATQESILKEVSQVRAELSDSISSVNARVDKLENTVKESAASSETRLLAYEKKNDDRVQAVEEKLTNLRLKVAGYGGAGGLFVLLIAELAKLKGGG